MYMYIIILQVPTLHDLTEELATWKGDGNLLNYKKTSLRPYIDYFDKFLEGLTSEPDLGADSRQEKMDISESTRTAIKSI